MISIEECHRILNDETGDEMFTKEEALQLRNFQMELAEIAFLAYSTQEEETDNESKSRRKEGSNL